MVRVFVLIYVYMVLVDWLGIYYIVCYIKLGGRGDMLANWFYLGCETALRILV